MAQRGFKVGLLDVDLHGPSTLKMLGLEGTPLGATGEFMIPIAFNENLKDVSIASWCAPTAVKKLI
jgi:Mrp family chromosome partitioning ATPase